MKKVTSTALLALQLTWKIVLLVFVLTLGVQLFFVCRELMPGGVPLQTTFGFETLIRSAVQGAGKWWMLMLMALLVATAGAARGSRMCSHSLRQAASMKVLELTRESREYQTKTP